jgi:hypothetical protein
MMKITDRILQWRKLRARKRRDYKAYFRIVDKIAKRQAAQMVKEKLSK